MLRMTREVHQWLDSLRTDDPRRLRTVGAAIMAALLDPMPAPRSAADGGAGPAVPTMGRPLVVPLEPLVRRGHPWDALDRLRTRRLELLQQAARGIADVATSVKRIDLQREFLASRTAALADEAQEAADQGQSELARSKSASRTELLELLAEITDVRGLLAQGEEELRVRHQESAARRDALQAHAQTALAMRTAARGQRLADEAELAAHGAADPDRPDGGAADAWAHAARARAKLVVRASSGPDRETTDGEPGEGTLMELRPGAPSDTSVRILFIAEPDGTAALREVGVDEPDWDRWYAATLPRARWEWSDTTVRPLAVFDELTFLACFFPGEESEVAAAADELSRESSGRALSRVRHGAGVSRGELAASMNAQPDDVTAVEEGPAQAELDKLIAYVEALGGHIEITADFAGERIPLR
jgi:hypothetical protein